MEMIGIRAGQLDASLQLHLVSGGIDVLVAQTDVSRQPLVFAAGADRVQSRDLAETRIG